MAAPANFALFVCVSGKNTKKFHNIQIKKKKLRMYVYGTELS
jgi:hypothetical protein